MAFSPTVFCLLFCCLSLVLCVRLNFNPRPKMSLTPRHNDYHVFTGNDSSVDHFSVTVVAGSSLLVGARNVVYKLDIGDLQQRQLLSWIATEQDKGVCLVKGKNEESCQNYIKVLEVFEVESIYGRYLICGTNAYKPLCREYVDDVDTFIMTNEMQGIGMCPYGPDHNSTALLDGDMLYAGTAADYQGVDPIIYRDPLRTPQFDRTYLYNPSFVGSFSHRDYVYFFFREKAVECFDCGPPVFSRVARVCKNDKGGTRSMNAKWTSFIKSRLDCSETGMDNIFFDEIQDISGIIEGMYGGQEDQLVYGVFTTPNIPGSGSAVCAFRLQDISDAFSGEFAEQQSPGENWSAVPNNLVPDHRPGTCSNNSRALNDVTLDFIKKHPLMNTDVFSSYRSPVLAWVGLNMSLTAIDVHGQVPALNGEKYDVIFVGTSTGILLKAINTARPVVIEEIKVFDKSVAVKDIIVVADVENGTVIVTSSSEIKSFPLFRCSSGSNCQDCVAMQDPYCAWSVPEGRCMGNISWARGTNKDYLQSVLTGKLESCPGRSNLSRQESVAPPEKEAVNAVEQPPEAINRGDHFQDRSDGIKKVKEDLMKHLRSAEPLSVAEKRSLLEMVGVINEALLKNL